MEIQVCIAIIIKSVYKFDFNLHNNNFSKGGPISVQNSTVTCIYYVVGITSFGPQQCGAQAGVYINVLSYLDWIEKIVWPN